jgi:hypothetical protein
MMLLNISCRDVAQSEGLSCSAFGEDKAELRPCVELRPAVLNEQGNYGAPCLDLCCNPSALRMNSLFSTEQGIGLAEQGIHLSKHGVLQFRLAHLAIEYRWLCSAKTK